jgi:hypothetical protein
VPGTVPGAGDAVGNESSVPSLPALDSHSLAERTGGRHRWGVSSGELGPPSEGRGPDPEVCWSQGNFSI